MTLFLLLLTAFAEEPTTDPGALATTEIGTMYNFGVGVSLGNPLGITGKLYLDDRRTAIEATIGTESWGPNYGGLYAHAVYLWHPGTILYDAEFEAAWHIGGGAFAGNWALDPGTRFNNWSTTRFSLGPRAMIGIDIDLTRLPLQIYADAALNLFIIPKPFPGLHTSVGVRYYF